MRRFLFVFWFFCTTVNVFFAQETYRVPVSGLMLAGQFQPTQESLKTHATPEWFRNAKFGIRAHWGPQCVEGSGDWMARSTWNAPVLRINK